MSEYAYEKEDFLTPAPYEELYKYHADPFVHATKLEEMSVYAEGKKFRAFKTMYKNYIQSLKAQQNDVYVDNVTRFSGQPLELNAGDWDAGEDGVFRKGANGMEYACLHPVMPVERLVNVDTGEEKLKLAFRKGGVWRKLIADKTVLASTSKVTELAGSGLAVTSQNARSFVQYISELENLNYSLIPEIKCVGRLGWIDEHGFSPYMDGIVFDGEDEYRDRFESVAEKGSYAAWLEAVRSIRKTECIATRIILAASFASILVKPCGCLPFFLHIWSTSEIGKTVGMMLAASVWANPEMGRYIQSFNATSVGKELGATFLNSLPLMLDELQMEDNNDRDKVQKIVYALAEGIGRNRGKRTGGLQKTGTWRNCIMTTGEGPINDECAAAGAVNRVIDLYCQDMKLFAHNTVGDAKAVAQFLQKNYGFAGKRFVQAFLEPGNMEKAVSLQNCFAAAISSAGDVTDKQSASAALVLAADALAEEWIFQDGVHLLPEDIVPYLATRNDIDQNRRALEFLYDQAAINAIHFDPHRASEKGIEIWGDVDPKYIYIIKPVFDSLLRKNGFNSKSFLEWAKRKKLIRTEASKKNPKDTVAHRIPGLSSSPRCVFLLRPSRDRSSDAEGDNELPL